MNLSIKAKLSGGFVLILILLITSAVLMMSSLTETNQRLNNIVDNSSRKITVSKNILINILDAARHEKNIIIETGNNEKLLLKGKINGSLEIIDKEIREMQRLTVGEDVSELEGCVTSWNSYKPSLNNMISLALEERDEEATRISIDKGMLVRDSAIAIINRIIEANEKQLVSDKTLSDESYKNTLRTIVLFVFAAIIISIIIAFWIIHGISKRIKYLAEEAQKIASREFTGVQLTNPGKDELKPVFDSLVNVGESFREVAESASIVASGDYSADFVPRSSKDVLGTALKKMTISLRETTEKNRLHNWFTRGQNELNEQLRGDGDPEDITTTTITVLCRYLDACVGALYLMQGDGRTLSLSGGYAYSSDRVQNSFLVGEGLVGQVAAERKPLYLKGVQQSGLQVVSSLIKGKPDQLMIVPFLFEGQVLGVVEIARLTAFTQTEVDFIHSSMESIGIAINSALARQRISQLLEETRMQSEELQSKQDELQQMNEELEEQARNLKEQQEELYASNQEMEEQTLALEIKNRELETAKKEIELQSKQVEVSSRYKSEFLANMSHELRTPLNSLLILSKDLSENKTGNLNPDQVESSSIIYKSGTDLLTLINEVLDLSKIEAGKMTLHAEAVHLKSFAEELHSRFRPEAAKRSLEFILDIKDDVPEEIISDAQRLNQIINNLLSNAFKFTQDGSITLGIARPEPEKIAISVTDTGIGIAEEKQLDIFEAFQQADGGTSRKYGGTGLGLSISRELARLLGGEIKLSSALQKGSTFTLVLPLQISQQPEEKNLDPNSLELPGPVAGSISNYPITNDDRKKIQKQDKVILIIEDDLSFAGILRIQGNSKGFKCVIAPTGEEGLLLAEKFQPQAIILDLQLPQIDGETVLARLKANPALRHIPVHIISARERSLDLIKEGALEYLTKPINKEELEEVFTRIENFISRKMRHVLIIEDDENSRIALRKLIGNGDVKCFEAGTGRDALDIFGSNHIDCIVLDLGLPDISGFSLIQKLHDVKENIPPIIVYTGRELTREENNELEKYAQTIIIKGVKSEERLLDETALFLHRAISKLPESKQRMITDLYDKELLLQSKKVLVVDDDMRNVFALSKILKELGMEVIKADNGMVALDCLKKDPAIDIVLMDIMMPVMNGYETMRKIRMQENLKKLPVIALTAKAMKEDRLKCIEAGASDYIEKPINVDRLISLMRVWLSQ